MPAHTPAEVHALYQRAFNLGDVDALAAMYEPDAVFVVDGREVTGSERIRQALESIVAGSPRMTLETRSAIETSRGIAVLHGRWVIERGEGEGRAVTRGLSTEVVRRQADGTWLFVIDNPRTPEGGAHDTQ